MLLVELSCVVVYVIVGVALVRKGR